MKTYTFTIRVACGPKSFKEVYKTDKGLQHAIDSVTAKFNISTLFIDNINIK